MLTRTSAEELRSDGILMTSVDTGWITMSGLTPRGCVSRARAFTRRWISSTAPRGSTTRSSAASAARICTAARVEIQATPDVLDNRVRELIKAQEPRQPLEALQREDECQQVAVGACLLARPAGLRWSPGVEECSSRAVGSRRSNGYAVRSIEVMFKLVGTGSKSGASALSRVGDVCSQPLVWAAFAAVLSLTGPRGRRAALRGVTCSACASLIHLPIKRAFGRPRPRGARLIGGIGPLTSSFRSGHTASDLSFMLGASQELPLLLAPLSVATLSSPGR